MFVAAVNNTKNCSCTSVLGLTMMYSSRRAKRTQRLANAYTSLIFETPLVSILEPPIDIGIGGNDNQAQDSELRKEVWHSSTK